MIKEFFRSAVMVATVAGCAPDNNFSGSSGLDLKRKINVPAPVDQPADTSKPLTDDLGNDDREVLAACQQKSKGLLKDAKMVEVENIGESLLNKEGFSDPYTGSEKRVLIINLTSTIANNIQLKLTNANTTYCLNIKSQIVNKLDIGLAVGARLIEVRQVSIINNSNVHQI